MEREDIFGFLVKYHIVENYSACAPYIIDGRFKHHKRGFLKEGGENDDYNGFLFVALSDHDLIKNLKADEIILDSKLNEADHVGSPDDLYQLLKAHGDMDGAYVIDSKNSDFVRVMELNNNPPGLKDKTLWNKIPPNFIYSKNTHYPQDPLDHEKKLGTKTRLAIKLPQAYYDSEEYQIKRQCFGDLGMGKVTHFDENGLVEEFYFEHAPESEGPFIDEKNKVIGVYKRYRPVFSQDYGCTVVSCVQEVLVDPKNIYESISQNPYSPQPPLCACS